MEKLVNEWYTIYIKTKEGAQMIVLNKKARIITAVVLFAAIAAGGLVIERLEKDAFIVEPISTEDSVLYIPEGEAVTEDKININAADAETLSELHGIGEQLAERIVDYRRSAGRFETIEEIMKVPGISEGKFEDIKDNITVE